LREQVRNEAWEIWNLAGVGNFG